MTRAESLNHLKAMAEEGNLKPRNWNPRWSRYSVWIKLSYTHRCEDSGKLTNTMTYYSYDKPGEAENVVSGERITQYSFGFKRLIKMVGEMEEAGALVEARFYDNLASTNTKKEPIMVITSEKNAPRRGWQKREYIAPEDAEENLRANGVQEATTTPPIQEETKQVPKTPKLPAYFVDEETGEMIEGSPEQKAPKLQLPDLSNEAETIHFASHLAEEGLVVLPKDEKRRLYLEAGKNLWEYSKTIIRLYEKQ